MADITMSLVTEIADPKLRPIAERALKTFQLAAEKAAAHQAEPQNFPIAPDPNSAEQVFLSRLTKLPPAKQQGAIAQALASVKAPDAQRAATYGDLAQINLRSAAAVEQQASTLAFPETLKFPVSYLDGLTELHGHILFPHALPIAPAGLAPHQALEKLEIRIQTLKCIEETTWETGDDEIALGGLTIDATGDTAKLNEFMVRDDFNQGVEQVYTPPKRFAWFDLNKGGGGQDLYAGIWEKSAGPAWVAHHAMTRAQYQKTFTDLGNQGYRLIQLSGYGVGGQDLYAGIWEKSAGPAWVAHHAMTRAQYQKTFTDLGNQGYRLIQLSGYGVGGQDLYAGIWEKSAGPAWVAHHAMTRAQYQKTFTDLGNQGYRLIQISGYGVDTVGGQSEDLYAGIWEESAGPAWVAHHALTPAQYQQTFTDLGNQGYRLVDVSGYSVGHRVLYAGIWEKSAGPAWVAHHGMTAAQYQQAFSDLAGKGYRLRQVSGYTTWPTFPKFYSATLVIAQKNDGGFYEFLVKLWEMVKEKVVALITAALGAAIGALIGTDVIPGLGTIVGAVVGWIVGSLFGWLKELFSDWIFKPFTVSVSVPSINARWPGGGTDSPQGWIEYKGYGGDYQLTFDWRLFA